MPFQFVAWSGQITSASGKRYRPAIRADSARPRHPSNELLSQQELAVRAIENVEKTVPIGMQQELSILSAKLRVHQYIGLGRIPIVNIVRSELVIPLQLSGSGIERQNAIR